MARIYSMTDSWTDAATTYSAIKMDVTDTASASGSKLLDLLVGGASKFSVSKTGDATINGITAGLGGGAITTNTAFGLSSLSANTTGYYNTAFGEQALKSVTTGNRNTAFGAEALRDVTTGIYNTVFGIGGASITTGQDNTLVGRWVGTGITTGGANTYMGSEAGFAGNGSSGTLIGYKSGHNMAGVGAVAVGAEALYSATTNPGTAVGYQALYNCTGITTTAMGYEAGMSHTTGPDGAYFGHQAGKYITSGTTNSAFGAFALGLTTTGSYNLGSGYAALYGNTIGSYNIGLGPNAGRWDSTAVNNSSGSASIFIGYDTHPLASGQTNQIVIGHQAVGNGSNTVTLGNTFITDTYLRGTLHFGTFATSADAPVNGYITIVDASGVTRKLATIA